MFLDILAGVQHFCWWFRVTAGDVRVVVGGRLKGMVGGRREREREPVFA